jgi:hypothetical protein
MPTKLLPVAVCTVVMVTPGSAPPVESVIVAERRVLGAGDGWLRRQLAKCDESVTTG